MSAPKAGKDRTGAERIADERKRQIEEEKYTLDHDRDEHDNGNLALAAACYASPVLLYEMATYAGAVHFGDPFPFDHEYDKRPHNGNVILPNATLKRKDRIRMLEKAGALIAAEIDRLSRTTSP